MVRTAIDRLDRLRPGRAVFGLCRIQRRQSYVSHPNWQFGFSVVCLSSTMYESHWFLIFIGSAYRFIWRGSGTFLGCAPEACERFSFCPRFLFSPARPRISAVWASHLRGSVGLGNWRGSRLRTVYRGIEIGTEVGKYRGSFPRFARRAWFADVGQSPVADGRHWSPGLGRLFNPSINTHGVGRHKTADIALSLDGGGVATAHGGEFRRETSICA